MRERFQMVQDGVACHTQLPYRAHPAIPPRERRVVGRLDVQAATVRKQQLGHSAGDRSAGTVDGEAALVERGDVSRS